MADTKFTGLTNQTTPLSGDIFPFVTDPGGTPTGKKVTWSNILATAKTYFDTLYSSGGGGGTPGGSDTEFQYNNGGAFGGVANLTFNDTSGAVTFAGSTDTTQLIFKANATQSASNPLVKFQNSAGTEISRLNFSNDSNVGIGYLALNALSTAGGTDCIAVGKNALKSQSSSSGVIAIGSNVLQNSTGGGVANSTAIGTNAAKAITGASEIVALGYSAMGGTGTGSGADWSIAIGSESLSCNTLTGTANIAIGRRAGIGLTTGGYNILLGQRAAESMTSGGNNIIIGYFVDAVSNTASSQLKIGEMIVGGSVYDQTNGSIGIGINSSSSSNLTLRGSSTSSSSLRITSGTAPTSPVNGDIWFDGTDIKMRIGGATKTFTLT